MLYLIEGYLGKGKDVLRSIDGNVIYKVAILQLLRILYCNIATVDNY